MLLYDSQSSGNAYKVRLLLALLGRAYERVEMDTDAGATRTPAFLELNPNGRIPLLVCDDGRRLPESNAILYYLATDTRYLPADSPRRDELSRLAPRGHAALAVMEGRLEAVPFFAGDHFSVADIALYAYTHVAHEGGFDLAPYPRVRAWIERCAAQPGHVPIDA